MSIKHMEKIRNFQEKQPEKELESQVIEGIIGESPEGWEKKLPPDISSEMVDILLGNDNLWHWHLRPEYIKNEKERERYKFEREKWP
jgi:hypothetical protein